MGKPFVGRRLLTAVHLDYSPVASYHSQSRFLTDMVDVTWGVDFALQWVMDNAYHWVHHSFRLIVRILEQNIESVQNREENYRVQSRYPKVECC